MKVYIQSNKYQKIAAEVAAYSFERFGLKTEYLNFEDNKLLNHYVGHSYLRNGKNCIFKDDLQSFTILRSLAPQLNKYKEKILVIDPDVFVLKDTSHMINLISDKFIKHPNDKVYTIVKNLFHEAIKENFIDNQEIEEAIYKGYIAKKIIN